MDELTTAEKLSKLNGLLIDKYIEKLESGSLGNNELGGIVTLLKNNKVIEEKKEHSEADVIDKLVDEV